MKRLVTAIVLTAMMAQSSYGENIKSADDGWPQWRGPCRDGISTETGLLFQWPKDGPKLLWTAEGLGRGYSSPIISDGTIYITGDSSGQLKIFAYSLDGKLKWETANGKSWKNPTPGSRASCCFNDGLLYHMNAHGRVVCLDPSNGREKWSVDLMEQYGAKNIMWGLSESVLIDGDAVIVTPASKKALMVALDKKTGKEIWATAPIDGETPAYSSALLVEHNGQRQIINCGSKHVFGVDAKSGKLLWKCPHAIKGSLIATTPSYHAGRVFVPGTWIKEAKSYCVKMGDGTGTVDWVVPAGDPTGSAVFTDGMIVAATSHKPLGWSCYDPETGKVTSKKADIQYGGAVLADDRYYGLAHDGLMMMMEIEPDGFKVVSEFIYKSGEKDVWAHPVVCDGKLYLRYHDKLHCYDVKKK